MNDLAARYLRIVVRLLPAGRRQWGRAMQAEPEALGGAAERRRFALSCTRAALRSGRAGYGWRFDRANLAASACAGVVAGAAAFVAMPFERIGAPLASGAPGSGPALALVIFGAPVAAALVTQRHGARGDQAVMAVLCAGAVTAVLAALLGLAAIRLFPGSIPDIVGPFMVPGTSAAERQAANATEATDPYAGLLVFGLLLAAVLLIAARPPRQAWATASLVFAFGLPAILLGATARDFPLSSTITFATLATVSGAIVTSRVDRAHSN